MKCDFLYLPAETATSEHLCLFFFYKNLIHKLLPVWQPMRRQRCRSSRWPVSPDFINRLDERHEATQRQQNMTGVMKTDKEKYPDYFWELREALTLSLLTCTTSLAQPRFQWFPANQLLPCSVSPAHLCASAWLHLHLVPSLVQFVFKPSLQFCLCRVCCCVFICSCDSSWKKSSSKSSTWPIIWIDYKHFSDYLNQCLVYQM